MQSEQGDVCRRVVWYVAGTLKMAGGGERLIMEGLRQFELMGLETTLLLGNPMPNQAALFDGTYTPNIQILDNQSSDRSDMMPSVWQRMIGRVQRALQRARRASAIMLSSSSTLVIATGPDDCRSPALWIAKLLLLRPITVHMTFVHGSPFQFAEDVSKYSMVFRRHFSQILDGDPVYGEMIPPKSPAMSLSVRLRLEWESLLNYLALRFTRHVVVHSNKNRREVELLYGRRSVAVIPAGGFSRAELTYRRCQDMKAAFQLSDRKVVLSVCRLVPKKRVDLSIRSFAEMIRQHPESDAIMVVAGEGTSADSLRALCRDLRVEDRVRFIGFIPESQLKDWYCSCDLFISTDNADYDLSVMMALPLACKVLVTKQYDFPGFLDKMHRYIYVAEPTAQSLAEVMHEAIQSVPAPLDATDFAELDNLTWERYFETLLSLEGKFSTK